jgi:hypothetical protein
MDDNREIGCPSIIPMSKALLRRNGCGVVLGEVCVPHDLGDQSHSRALGISVIRIVIPRLVVIDLPSTHTPTATVGHGQQRDHVERGTHGFEQPVLRVAHIERAPLVRRAVPEDEAATWASEVKGGRACGKAWDVVGGGKIQVCVVAADLGSMQTQPSCEETESIAWIRTSRTANFPPSPEHSLATDRSA